MCPSKMDRHRNVSSPARAARVAACPYRVRGAAVQRHGRGFGPAAAQRRSRDMFGLHRDVCATTTPNSSRTLRPRRRMRVMTWHVPSPTAAGAAAAAVKQRASSAACMREQAAMRREWHSSAAAHACCGMTRVQTQRRHHLTREVGGLAPSSGSRQQRAASSRVPHPNLYECGRCTTAPACLPRSARPRRQRMAGAQRCSVADAWRSAACPRRQFALRPRVVNASALSSGQRSHHRSSLIATRSAPAQAAAPSVRQPAAQPVTGVCAHVAAP
jgi:hypothetical protein